MSLSSSALLYSAEPGLITHRSDYGWARSGSLACLRASPRLFSAAWCVVCSRYYGPVSDRGVWMAVLIRTSDVPPAHRYEAWRNIVCDTLGPLDFRSDPEVPLSGVIEAGHLGPVTVGRVQTSTPHSVHRTPGLIRRGSAELYRVVLAMSGKPRLGQDGRAAQLRPGEFAIYDFARPYELAYDSPVQLAVFGFPRARAHRGEQPGMDHQRGQDSCRNHPGCGPPRP
jgi:hypothetical protein